MFVEGTAAWVSGVIHLKSPMRNMPAMRESVLKRLNARFDRRVNYSKRQLA